MIIYLNNYFLSYQYLENMYPWFCEDL